MRLHRIYDITYDKYYPSAPKEIMLQINKHAEEIDIKNIIKNICGYEPISYRIE
jgi:hypothetical protein